MLSTFPRLAFAGLTLFCSAQSQASEPTPATAPEKNLIAQGKYIAQLGDCIACHTAKGGAVMAGGLELKTPMGTIYSSNITPDPETGIGQYSFEQFDKAMRQGVTPAGQNLYPAMPYPSYAKMSEDDMRALYAYLMQDVAPVKMANLEADMGFPFNQRWGLALWNWAFVDNQPFAPDPAKSPELNRGAYLVQGLGHCGSCHTPRGIAFQEKAMSDTGSAGKHYLAGETVEEWRALSLRNLWTVEDTVQLLKTGQNRFATVSGNMADVIHHSTQHFTDADLTAIASYLKSLPAGKDDLPMPTVALTPARAPDTLYSSRGGLGYTQFCADCHRPDGGGVPGMFPPLNGNPGIVAANPTTLLHITLTGWKTPQTAAHPRVYTMPGFARLQDDEIAEILSFVRSSWGNAAPAIKPAQVAKMRKQLNPSTDDESAFVTPRLANLLSAANADQVVRGMRLHLQTKALLPDNVGNALNCTSCHLNAGTVADGSPFVGVSAFFPSYAPRAGKDVTLEERINGCFRRSMDGKPLPVASADMQAMVAYFDWMKMNTVAGDKVAGRGVGKVDPTIKPDPVNGKAVYVQQCAVCHGDNGEGLKHADGSFVYPPLWGDESFNIGAGMARTYTAAAFVKRNMPIGMHEKFPLGQGGLSDQDAVDVAEYFSHQPRPDFVDKAKDWPKGGKPVDARY
ncbi:c-type cytochrome [Pseudomonas fragi]|uniref:C-type cytochrome n=1 Tax=Pseudomonas fragi TaxID=296 RepID=A0A9Q5FMT7_PSEFR|nr:c-type cytochrome [Pseudomonas fragi]ARQ74607.1 cytochrome C [Pseudomonas fragi]MBM1198486.1 c-type cytochrome [Pseudomonas fragi]MDE4516066.1 c-type cytochrome [Pseudomonas fragi]NNB01500.1 c-type cytochrome [Pseudomonas fragi]NNB16228.1 c-type cytochrome [Pseudomonas fragi]